MASVLNHIAQYDSSINGSKQVNLPDANTIWPHPILRLTIMSSNLARCGLLMLLFSSVTAQACSWQIESKPGIDNFTTGNGRLRPGQPKGGAKYRVQYPDEAHFLDCIGAFAHDLGFKLFSARSAKWPDGRSFVDLWYLHDDGAILSVTDITTAGKFGVIFYGQRDGRGAAAARNAFRSFENGMAEFDKIEAVPEVPDK